MKRLATAIILVGCICWLSAGAAYSFSQYTSYPVNKPKCVPPESVINSWRDAVSKIDQPRSGVISTYAVCDPCKCPINGMAACYEYMAEEERSKTEKYNQVKDLLYRAENYGICR